MTREALLAELNSETYVMIKPSPVEGIGVFAIRDIPKGCCSMFSKPGGEQEEWLKIPRPEIDLLPPHSRQLIETYCLYDDDHYFVPEYGFKKMDLVNFLNHSDTPNIISINEGEYFEAIRNIASGEELLVDYGELVTEK
ncbi:MAG: SET domain-containing protein [Ferruginibacter sp.]|nr:SET domain-containing protein [Ferruginibacter sp.]